MKDFTIEELESGLVWAWLEEVVLDGEPCIDNYRFAPVANRRRMEQYEYQRDRGCCGSVDLRISIDRVPHMIGANFGH